MISSQPASLQCGVVHHHDEAWMKGTDQETKPEMRLMCCLSLYFVFVLFNMLYLYLMYMKIKK